MFLIEKERKRNKVGFELVWVFFDWVGIIGSIEVAGGVERYVDCVGSYMMDGVLFDGYRG